MHDLRRTAGSWAAATGASTLVIGRALGHRTQEATAVYARLGGDPVKKAMDTATTAMLVAAGVMVPLDAENETPLGNRRSKTKRKR
jgi:hypothetical protein